MQSPQYLRVDLSRADAQGCQSVKRRLTWGAHDDVLGLNYLDKKSAQRSDGISETNYMKDETVSWGEPSRPECQHPSESYFAVKKTVGAPSLLQAQTRNDHTQRHANKQI